MWPFKKREKEYMDLTGDVPPPQQEMPSFSNTLPQNSIDDIRTQLRSIEERIIEVNERIKVIEARLAQPAQPYQKIRW